MKLCKYPAGSLKAILPSNISQSLPVCFLQCLHLYDYVQNCRSLQNNADESEATELENPEKLLTVDLSNTKSKKVHFTGSVDTCEELLNQ